MLLRMGPFTVDFVLEQGHAGTGALGGAGAGGRGVGGGGSGKADFLQKKAVLLVDNLSSFLVNDFRFTEETILRHRLLEDMGLEIFRVSWHEWVAAADKRKFIAEVFARGPVSSADLLRRQATMDVADAARFARLSTVEATADERRSKFRPHFERYRRWLTARPRKIQGDTLENLAL